MSDPAASPASSYDPSWEAYAETRAAYQPLDAGQHSANKAVLFAALAAAGISQVLVTFDGYGDSGQIESVDARAGDDAIDLPAATVGFQQKYGSASLSASDAQLVGDARARWQNTVGGLQDSMRVQAGVVGNIDANRAEMDALVTRSQGAVGALQATQAGNQLLALQAQQLADLTAVVAANGRAQALQSAEQAAAAEQGREQRRRFLTPGTGYQPGNARMFNGND